MSDAIELLDDIEKYYGSLNDVPECVVKYFDYLSSMICNETKESRLSILTELERAIVRYKRHWRWWDRELEKFFASDRQEMPVLKEKRMQPIEFILTLIRSKKGGA